MYPPPQQLPYSPHCPITANTSTSRTSTLTAFSGHSRSFRPLSIPYSLMPRHSSRSYEQIFLYFFYLLFVMLFSSITPRHQTICHLTSINQDPHHFPGLLSTPPKLLLHLKTQLILASLLSIYPSQRLAQFCSLFREQTESNKCHKVE